MGGFSENLIIFAKYEHINPTNFIPMRIYIITATYLLFPLLIIFLFKRYKLFQKVGTVILAYAVGIIMALTGMTDFGQTADAETLAGIQKWIMNLAVPIAIPLMLFSSNFKLWTKSLPKTILALAGGLIAILVAVISAFFIFRNSGIDDLADVAGMMTGIYTGGTMNFYALGAALEVDPNTITFVYTFEMLVTFPLLVFIVGGGYKLFRKWLPFPDEAITINTDTIAGYETNGVENYHGMLKRKTFPKMMLGLGLSILFLAIGAGLSFLTTGKLNELVIILTITTLAIAASFNKKIRELPKTFELGMFFILIFSIVVASQFDIYGINTSVISLLLFVLYIMLVAVGIHLLLCRIFKISGDLFGVASIGLLCSPPFIPPVAGAMGNQKVLISGIIIGLVGYAVGTYLGAMVAYVLSSL